MSTHAIYGPPGTGKTSELLRRMAELKVPAGKIGFLAFTRAAAGEALHRLGIRKSDTIRTIHSLCYQLAGCSREQIIDAAKLKEFSELVGYTITGKQDTTGPLEAGDEMMAVVQYAQARMITTGAAHHRLAPDLDPDVVDLFARSYERWKAAYGYLDFNDLLFRVALGPDVDLGIDHLYVDEAQDLSPLQWLVINKISERIDNVVLAGDDDQAIYTWAGADPHGMRTIARTHEVLKQSHRVPASVHTLAESVISRVRDRVRKDYSPRTEEGSVAFWNDLDYISRPDPRQDTLVLYRNHTQRADVEDWLIQNSVPYTTGDSSASGWFQDRYARALRAYRQLTRGQDVSQAQWDTLAKVATPAMAEAMRKKHSITKWLKEPWQYVLRIPAGRMDYLTRVDLNAEPKVRISTIHSAKGAEADRVILMNGMGARTYEAMDDNEARVWYVAVTRPRHTLDIIQHDNPYLQA